MTSLGTAGPTDGSHSVEALMASILERVPQPVWVVDEDDEIIYANPAASAALGYEDPDDLRGKPSHDTVHYKRRDGSPYPLHECPLLRPRGSVRSMHGEEWFVRRDGSLFEIEWWSQPLQLPTGHASVFSFIDLSERRAMEQAIREREVAQIRAGEARAAQRRIVEGTTAVRRRVAHDLHDGAQRHLVSLLIDLRLAQEELVSDPAHVPALLDVVADHTQAAIDELRGFVAGIHPSILATRGLSPAVRALATDAALPVHVSGSVGRLPQLIEANAYFFVAEALTNVAKHAHASHADVSLARDESCLLVEVCDDGVGGVTIPGDGHQLAALADRIDALDGTLTIESPPRVGTTLRAEIPLSAAGR